MSAPRVSIIAAVARNGVIGRAGQLPWRLPIDLARFKRLTMGHHLIMGRRTWDERGTPLPGRTSVVVSRRADFAAPGALHARTLDEAIALCAGDSEAFVAGGTELFREALPRADRVYLTEIDRDYEGDTRFPPFDPTPFRAIEREVVPASGDQPQLTFVTWERV